MNNNLVNLSPDKLTPFGRKIYTDLQGWVEMSRLSDDAKNRHIKGVLASYSPIQLPDNDKKIIHHHLDYKLSGIPTENRPDELPGLGIYTST